MPHTPTPAELGAVPRRLGPYALVRALGQGGMASVYEAVHVGLGKRVALKVLQPHRATETMTARFLREGRAIAKIRHPQVVEVFDVGVHEGTHYLVMEFLDGMDLAELLKARGRLSLDETLEILLPIIGAVAAAHEAGIVHRDIKPANIFLQNGDDGKPKPKIVDFGIATFVEKEGDLDLTETNTILGTLRYMAPEQTRGAKYADARSDQYSLGVIFYLCTTGQTPYTGEGVYEMIDAIRHAPFVPPSAHAKELPRAFDEVIERALAREPQKRFASVAELGQALASLPRAERRAFALPRMRARTLLLPAALAVLSAFTWVLVRAHAAPAVAAPAHEVTVPEVSVPEEPSTEIAPTVPAAQPLAVHAAGAPVTRAPERSKPARPAHPHSVGTATPKPPRGSNGSPILE